MKNQIELQTTILAHKNDSFETKEGQTIQYASVTVRVNENLIKLSALKSLDFTDAIDQPVILTLSLTPDATLKPKLKVVGYRLA